MKGRAPGSRRWLWGAALGTAILLVNPDPAGTMTEAKPELRPGARCAVAEVGTDAKAAGGAQVTEESFQYVGSRKCRACHLREYRSWEKTPHAQAFDLLNPGVRAEAKQAAGLDPNNDYTGDAECIQCHTVGFGRPTGFESIKASSDLAGAGCEACHGPGSGYNPDGVMGLKNRNHSFEEVIAKGLIYPVPAQVCQSCHNDRSPFNSSVDPKYAFEYTRTIVEQATHEHAPLKYDHGPLPPGVMFQEKGSR